MLRPLRGLFMRFFFNYSAHYAIKQKGTLNTYLHEIEGKYCEGLNGAIMLHESILKHYENDSRFGEFLFVRLSDIL